jgi:hypothetical protein
MENIGDAQNALIRDFTIDFPNATDPVFFPIFPASYYEDVTFDGVKDLIFAPNVFSNATGDIDFRNSSWLYVNQGSASNPDYQQVTREFLQGSMIDLGDRSAPAFADWDGDGDQDMIVGYDATDNGTLIGRLALFLNEGTFQAPEFSLVDEDLLDLSSLDFLGLRPYFEDLDQDNIPDLILTGTDNPPIRKFYFFRNNAGPGEAYSINTSDRVMLNINSTTSENPAFLDEDEDGLKDLFLGTSQGNLAYYRCTSVNPFSFELILNNYAGLAPDPERPSLAPSFADLDNNGEPELITLDRSGKMRIFSDVRLSPTPEMFEDIILEDEELKTSTFGERTVITAADLGGNGLPSLVLGTAQGGMIYLENNSLEGPPTGIRIAFKMYPNPTDRSESRVTILGNRTGTYQIVSLTGRIIRDNIEIRGNTPTPVDLTAFPPGLYLVRAQSPGFGTSSGKLIISE